MRIACALIGALLGGACTSARDGGGAVVRDSAGIRIVESPAPAWSGGGGWRLGEPVLDIGGADAVSEATAGARLSDGRIVLRHGAAAIRYHAPDGTVLRTVAGDSGGFQAILSITPLRRDSLLVYDYGAHRLLVLGPDGASAGSTALPVLGRGLPPHRPHRLADGTIIGSATRGPQPLATFEPEALLRDSMIVYRYWPGDGRVDTLAAFPHVEVFVRIEGGTRGSVPYPFGRTSVLGVSRGRIIAGDGNAPELRVLTHEGELREIHRWSAQPEPVTDDDLRAFVDAAREALAGSPEDLRERTVARILGAPRPTTKAPYAQLRVDEEGNLWLGEPALFGAEPERWTVLAADGRWLGDVELPAGVRLLHIGRDHVLARWRVAGGGERVRLHPLIRP